MRLFPLCMHLDERGRPCNRRVMRNLTMCSLHRATSTASGPGPSAEYQRKRRARLRNAGVAVAWETA